MFKRRVGILGAVGVLALSILSGSAMADETPAPAPDAGIVCRSSDGQVVSFAKPVKAIRVVKEKDGKVAISEVEPGERAEVARRALSPEEAEKLAKDLPEGAPRLYAKRAEPADEAGAVRFEEGERVKGREDLDAVPAVPALPAEGFDGAPPEGVTGPAVTVLCEAEDK
ncbi:hypothetical protein [Nonomuraea sp. NPDC050691]|uniref:hypothetical protein n=1 Tax=Nonomuraea sp. NPDC050691 TaxID=3155661 RepID=UPI0033FFED33